MCDGVTHQFYYVQLIIKVECMQKYACNTDLISSRVYVTSVKITTNT